MLTTSRVAAKARTLRRVVREAPVAARAPRLAELAQLVRGAVLIRAQRRHAAGARAARAGALPERAAARRLQLRKARARLAKARDRYNPL